MVKISALTPTNLNYYVQKMHHCDADEEYDNVTSYPTHFVTT